MPINPEAVGATGQPRLITWTSTDALLYAVGLGAGRDDLRFSTENSIGTSQSVYPTFPVIFLGREPESSAMQQLGEFDLAMAVHGSQALTLHRPTPVEGTATVVDRITAVYDKGKAAVVVTEDEATSEAGEPLWTLRTSSYIRGEGGWGGDRGPSGLVNQPPDREPDHQSAVTTTAEQPYTYRLSGDRNPLHTDPQFAARAGFDRPIMHGLCTYGMTSRVLLRAFCDDDVRLFRHIEGRFSAPVAPGEQLTVRAWRVDGGALFTTSVGDRVVIDQGLVQFDEGSSA